MIMMEWYVLTGFARGLPGRRESLHSRRSQLAQRNGRMHRRASSRPYRPRDEAKNLSERHVGQMRDSASMSASLAKATGQAAEARTNSGHGQGVGGTSRARCVRSASRHSPFQAPSSASPPVGGVRLF